MSAPRANFAPGPSQPLPGLAEAAARAFAAGLPGWNHRSPEFTALMERLDADLRRLLALPEDWSLWFVSSASYAMELALRNLVRERAWSLDLGAFSRRFAEIGLLLGRRVAATRIPSGEGLWSRAADPAAWIAAQADPDAEAWLLCHNETATGVALPLEQLPPVRPGDPLRLVDAVSIGGACALPLDRGDLWMIGAQKAFGCPPGLALLLVAPRARARAAELVAEGRDVGAWFSFERLELHARRFQAPCTPNTLGLALLAEAAAALAAQGMPAIEAATRAKSARLYGWLEDHPRLAPLVAERRDRSPTVVALRWRDGRPTAPLKTALAAEGLVVGGGYGALKESTLRVAAFPAHGMPQLDELVAAADRLSAGVGRL